jgi:hypothetical protein
VETSTDSTSRGFLSYSHVCYLAWPPPPLTQDKFEMLHQRLQFAFPQAQRANDADKQCASVSFVSVLYCLQMC